TCPVEVVNLGVDIDKLTYRDRKPGKTIGWLNRIGSGKGIELLCQIIYKMVKYSKDYKFEIVGQCNTAWLMKYLIEFLNRNGLNDNVKIMPEVVNVNEWMDSIDYIMSTSMKECMSLPLAEGMAKGIKPVIHNWWGADELYPGDLIFQTAEQACDIIMSQQYDSNFYRKFVEDKYTLNMQVNKLNKIMGL
ncbi:MAG: glycosyltransferase family 4 protein, partial [Candidatus Pacebacteria bacterium]|nr:glycosyltransferase family 4 protein [Candidatus Paceibacterota bacterium]